MRPWPSSKLNLNQKVVNRVYSNFSVGQDLFDILLEPGPTHLQTTYIIYYYMCILSVSAIHWDAIQYSMWTDLLCIHVSG